ncbi:MAG: PVC-type heme-binding CxxCH protein [Prosthecobacter sp.]|uniref:PVC-type heme-binding CxxCH protein n=1 Tax=Prosthecobacter sp. TaxID=1965333 RepID=UPI0038FDC8EE
MNRSLHLALTLLLLAFSIATGMAHEASKAVPLFDGKTLDGWDFDPKLWRVEAGMLTGGSTTETIKENVFISTKQSFHNFELKLKIKVSGDPKTGMLNSGIQIRSQRVAGGAHMTGYQIDCGEGWFGKIYDESRRNQVIWAPSAEQQAALDKAIDLFGWNEYRIRAEGPRIQTWINGVLCIDYTEQDKNIALDGHIAPQVHSGGICLAQVKDVTIEELPATPDAPTWEKLGGIEAALQLAAPLKKSAGANYNNLEGTALTAEEQLKQFHLPPGYEIELVAKESDGLGKFISVYFDQRGRMWTQTALEYPVDANENPAAAEAVYANKGKDKVLVYPRESLNAALPAGGLTSPTIFADGLAIPLGILPWGNGDTCYVQHGHDLKLFKDTNGDGKADTFDIVLTGFGVQDSHLFPHQFTRAPGGWIWMAQGLFNNSKVHKPGSDQVIDWPGCSMARIRPDGSQFEVTSVGPNNIWGLVITGEGETFIQEANDYGYPVMPFHEYAYYPGGMESHRKSYQPGMPPQTEIRMGGTGLSGLALGEGAFRKLTPSVKDDGLCMFVANPIISKIQTIAMHREPSSEKAPNGWRLEQAEDLITCDDPFFRPVGMTNGPDGCIYITDWYNKIISHNEVPRAHPDRDKTRGRIWRVKPKQSSHLAPRDEQATVKTDDAASKPSASPTGAGGDSKSTASTTHNAHLAERDGYFPIPDFTKLSTEALLALLGTQPTARAHIAWQTLADRWNDANGNGGAPFEYQTLVPELCRIAAAANAQPASRIQALWALHCMIDNHQSLAAESVSPDLLSDPIWQTRREAIAASGRITPSSNPFSFGYRFKTVVPTLISDLSSEVRRELIQSAGSSFARSTMANGGEGEATDDMILLLGMAKPSLPGPTTQASHNPKQVPTGPAYDREFERYLVRLFLERQPEAVTKFLDTDEAAKLPVEARVLASLALEPKASAARVAKLLPQLDRAPNDEELLRLAQFPDEAGCGDALKALLSNTKSRAAVANSLLTQKTKLDPTKIAPLLTEAGKALLTGDDNQRALGVSLIGAFQLAALETDLLTMVKNNTHALPSLQALRELRSGATDVFADLAKSSDPTLRDEALAALASSKNPNAAEQLLALYPSLNTAQQHAALNALSASKPGATAIVAALSSKRIPTTDLDGPTAERLSLVLGKDAELAKLMASLGHVFHDVLAFDGSDDAWIDSHITLDGPFTVEAWVRLSEGISNEDELLGVPGGVEMNFFLSKFRVFAGPPLNKDVLVATKPITPDLWTHIAVTRDATGNLKLYQNGELDAVSAVPAPTKWENCRIGWSGAAKGTQGMMTEFRVWKTERTAGDIRGAFDRSGQTDSLDLVKGLQNGTRIAKTTDYPPILTNDQAEALDKKFTRYTALAHKPGNIANGKALSALCLACHTIGSTGGQIGPNLSGAGAMGLEAVLRNILTPNAAMEPGYRIFRLELTTGDIVDAFYISEDKQAYVIRQPGQQDRRIPKPEVRSTRYIRRSLMPEGLIDALSETQITDLMSYLMTLK